MPNKILVAAETPVVFTDTGGVNMTMSGVAFGAGRVSLQKDRGTGSLAQYHEVIGVFQFQTNPVVGEAIEIYAFQSDGTYVDGNVGVVDAALTTDKRRNGMLVGSVIVDVATSGTNMVGRFSNVPITSRYYSMGVWNASAAANLKASGNACRIIVTPDPDEIQ